MLANVREDHSIPLTFSAQSFIQKERLRGTCKWQRKIVNVDPCYVSLSVDVMRLHSRQEKLAYSGVTYQTNISVYIERPGWVENLVHAMFSYLRQHKCVRSIKESTICRETIEWSAISIGFSWWSLYKWYKFYLIWWNRSIYNWNHQGPSNDIVVWFSWWIDGCHIAFLSNTVYMYHSYFLL